MSMATLLLFFFRATSTCQEFASRLRLLRAAAGRCDFFTLLPMRPWQHTEHTMLAGEGATAFARMLGMQEEDLSTEGSRSAHQSWESKSCQPNYYREFDGAGDSCPPYPAPEHFEFSTAGNEGAVSYSMDAESTTVSGRRAQREWRSDDPARLQISETNHDTIGMVIVDGQGNVVCRTTTNGAANKVAGRVGDSPIAGAGCYVDNDVGGAAATGDGDVMMRCARSCRIVPG